MKLCKDICFCLLFSPGVSTYNNDNHLLNYLKKCHRLMLSWSQNNLAFVLWLTLFSLFFLDAEAQKANKYNDKEAESSQRVMPYYYMHYGMWNGSAGTNSACAYVWAQQWMACKARREALRATTHLFLGARYFPTHRQTLKYSHFKAFKQHARFLQVVSVKSRCPRVIVPPLIITASASRFSQRSV